jgi:hypothetical protein
MSPFLCPARTPGRSHRINGVSTEERARLPLLLPRDAGKGDRRAASLASLRSQDRRREEATVSTVFNGGIYGERPAQAAYSTQFIVRCTAFFHCAKSRVRTSSDMAGVHVASTAHCAFSVARSGQKSTARPAA